MSQGLMTIGMLAGGLGFFMLAMSMITDGLRVAAGQSLRQILGRWTSSLGRGVVTGMCITALIQSSSAVTVATIGFVNAGLLTMHQALGIVFGSNVGTTMTGWLVAIVGFKIKVELFALPLIGIGMLLKLTGGDTRRAPLGLALAGFGVFFIGIDVLREAFEGGAALLEIERLTLDGIVGLFLFLGIGFLMTLLTQSSSAAIAIILTAATSGLVGLYAAAAMVIGANVGTTSTAGFAVIGATSNAKRVAAAHVIFNLATGVIALCTLPLLFWIVGATGKILGLEGVPAVTLALFHTTFNILGLLLMWPVSERLARFLEKRFVTREETESRPRYLDKNVAVSPALALDAITMELSRVVGVVRRMAMAALSTESGPTKRIAVDHEIAEHLAREVSEFIGRLGRESLTTADAEQMAGLLRAEQHLLAAADYAYEVAQARAILEVVDEPALGEQLGEFRLSVIHLLEHADIEAPGFSIANCEDQLNQVQANYEAVKDALLRAGGERRSSVSGVIGTIEQNSRVRRMARQMVKALRFLSEPCETVELRPWESDPIIPPGGDQLGAR